MSDPTGTDGTRRRGVPLPEGPALLPRAGHARRRAYCPLCGEEQVDKPVSELPSLEAALCVGRCAVAWQVLTALRVRESKSELIAARRRTEWDRRQAVGPTLSEVLLGRWRAGDWAVRPEDLIDRV